ncbi:HlyD family efflux transporter periplasmic adaptor subunit [Parahaliea maris]|uniref:HlyD family efflux transporter periplasmic adaptor subunit n=1 Tax=Parahaliea maris TaxID=2716870 RepID=A0A5C9A361_9GAMM|nr:HlyD family efflux transporter periplasmic adaptor subunit [Parahaliea maris]TXS95198.1 HlyD family efflux transporter periplasmic adaptor subunit [Parahaliea maris]
MTEHTRADANVTFLEQTLWQQFRTAAAPEAFVSAWLALQCQYLPGTHSAVVVLGEPGGPFAPFASWPESDSTPPHLAATAQRCLQERRPVAIEQPRRCLAVPLELDGDLCGAVAVLVEGSDTDSRPLLWRLRWGTAWLECLLRRQQGGEDERQKSRTILAFDLIGLGLEQRSFDSACHALVSELATRLDCDPVSIGFLQSRRIQLQALSHSAQFGERMGFVQSLQGAMEEAIDQDAVILVPPPRDWEHRICRAHQDLLESHRAGSALTVPLKADGTVIGAITLERTGEARFREEEVELVDAAMSVLGPLLELRRRDDRPLWRKALDSGRIQLERLVGPHHIGRKLATAAALLLVGAFTVVTGDYRVTSPAVVEGLVQRAIIAPFDGYIGSQLARAGEVVDAGQLIATLDDQDLALERIRWSTKRNQGMAEYDQALAGQERAAANIIRAELAQAEAQIQLLDLQLERTRIRAPFAGVLVAGDLSQKVGAAVRRGEELFRLAPLEDHRVILRVDEGDVMDLEVGQHGALRLAAMPDQTLEYAVTLVTSMSEQAEGHNFFRVEAVLDREVPQLRPGMEGIAKTRVEDRLVIRIWSEKLVDWLRLFIWKWSP